MDPLSKSESQPATKWWLWATLSPVVGLIFGLLTATCVGPRQDDWLGIRGTVPVAGGLLAGCALSCILTIVSMEKREKRAQVAFIVAIPSGLFVAFAILGMTGPFLR